MVRGPPRGCRRRAARQGLIDDMPPGHTPGGPSSWGACGWRPSGCAAPGRPASSTLMVAEPLSRGRFRTPSAGKPEPCLIPVG
jgi:hypothetical protein